MSDSTDELFPDGTRATDGAVVLAGRYRIVRELGRGGMGTVYLAEDLTLDALPVALKMLPVVLVHDAQASAGLKREALLARKLTHPSIVTLRTFESTAEGSFLVMDYIEGRTLGDVLADRGCLAPDDVQELFKPLAEALDYAHSQGVIHRDIKPSNVLIRSDGTALLTDFGIARELTESLTRVTGRTTSGTLPYMSPEQLRGAEAESAQDVYSLAATMYECLAGHPPFHRGAIEHQIETVEASPPTDRATPLARSILRGLAKLPNARPVSCDALVRAVGVKRRLRRGHVGATGQGDARRAIGAWLVGVGLVACAALFLWWSSRVPDAPAIVSAADPSGVVADLPVASPAAGADEGSSGDSDDPEHEAPPAAEAVSEAAVDAAESSDEVGGHQGPLAVPVPPAESKPEVDLDAERRAAEAVARLALDSERKLTGEVRDPAEVARASWMEVCDLESLPAPSKAGEADGHWHAAVGHFEADEHAVAREEFRQAAAGYVAAHASQSAKLLSAATALHASAQEDASKLLALSADLEREQAVAADAERKATEDRYKGRDDRKRVASARKIAHAAGRAKGLGLLLQRAQRAMEAAEIDGPGGRLDETLELARQAHWTRALSEMRGIRGRILATHQQIEQDHLRGMAVLEVDEEGRTGLHRAARADDGASAKRALDLGVGPDLTDDSGYTALHWAAWRGTADVIGLILRGGCRVNLRAPRSPKEDDPLGSSACGIATPTALHLAAYSGHPDALAQLLDAGADLGLRLGWADDETG